MTGSDITPCEDPREVLLVGAPLRSVLNRHVLVDRVILGGLRAVFNRRRPYFRNGVESPPFDVHLDAVEFSLPAFDGPGLYEFTADTAVRSLDAAVKVGHWVGTGRPTVVFHHGGGEYPFDTTFRSVFPLSTRTNANLLVVRTPGHDRRGGVLDVGGTLSTYLAAMAVSVETTERVLERVDTDRSVVTGISLGGFVTNRHHIAYDSATAYVPIIAGTRHADTFLSTYPAAAAARKRAEYLQARLNFDGEWRETTNRNVLPVLGLYDTLNRYEIQAPSYGDAPPEVWHTGHLTTALASDRICSKINRYLSGR